MSLERLFDPRSIAVVGGSPDLAKPGGRALASILKSGFAGAIYPVNPRYETIGALPCYPDLKSLPSSPDLVAFLVPAAFIPDGLREAARTGCRAALICASGFAESGEAGAALQQEIGKIAAVEGIAVVGPNSLGFVDFLRPIAVTFSTAMPDAIPARLNRAAMITQSGAIGARLLAISLAEGTAFGKMVSTGNEAITRYDAFIDHFAKDPGVDTLIGFIEGLSDGRAFVEAARRAHMAGKTVAILKAGTTDAGNRAARSHTGSLVGSVEVFKAAFRRAGIVPLAGMRHALDLALVPAQAPMPQGEGAGIVSTSGGAGVLMADSCHALGLSVPIVGGEVRDALAQILPPMAGMSNPVDVGPVYLDHEKVVACLDRLAEDPKVGFILAFLVLYPEIVEKLAAIQEKHGKPIFLTPSGGPQALVQSLRDAGIAAYEDLGRMTAVAGLRHRASLPLSRCGAPVDIALSPRGKQTREALRAFIADGRSALTERETKMLLASYGIPVSREFLATSADEALERARQLGGPLAVKAEAPDLLHKSDAGAIRLNVEPADAGAAFRAVTEAASRVVGAAGVNGALIQEMARPGVEFLAGVSHDPQFGPLVTIGLGGLMSEALGDVVTELAPIDATVAREMLGRLRGAALLGPFRGQVPRDVDALAEMMVALGDFAMDAGGLVTELDLNPVISHEEGRGCTAVDALAVLANDRADGGR